MFNITPVPAFQDNYIWLAKHPFLPKAFVVDPGDAKPVLDVLKKENIELAAILLTHKHPDHTGGVEELLAYFPNIPVYAHLLEKIPTTTHHVKHNDIVQLKEWNITFKIIHIPGHTLGHIAFYSHPVLFCGDTLFAAGCGRIFEGTPKQMYKSLMQLASLPDDTQIYCGHEYTLANLIFAQTVEPDNNHIKHRIIEVKKQRDNNQPTLPSTLAIEKQTNPFLRCSQSSVIEATTQNSRKRLHSPVDVFRETRLWKDKFIQF